MIPPDLAPVLLPVVQVLEALTVPYQIGGSLASSLWGTPRSTQDADLLADLRLEHVAPFATALEGSYYVDAQALADAVHRRGSFNLIHFDTMFKIDIFLRKADPFDDETFRRARRASIGELPEEQAVLHRLKMWYCAS